MSEKIIIYTDGACIGNPGPGGWAVLLMYGEHKKEIVGHHALTTNNRMELQAAIEALKALKRPSQVVLYTDSEYVKNGITQWIINWKSKGWRRSPKHPVKNLLLWQELDSLNQKHQVEWQWIKGHAGHQFNERVDKLANQEAEKARKLPRPKKPDWEEDAVENSDQPSLL
jgi:ribonuclease HI